MKIIFAGTPDFARVILQGLLNTEHKIIAVYTQPDRPSGRGRHLTPSPVKELALKNNIPVEQPESLQTSKAVAKLAAYQADLMIVVAYGLILSQQVLDIPKDGCWNVHASLLPRWRGAAPIQRAIEAGDNETGVCIMQMDAGLDTGDVLLSQKCQIGNTDTSQSLHDKLAELGAKSLITALEQLANSNLTKISQADFTKQTGVTACYAKKLTKQEANINWNESAVVIERKIRAFNPWPGAWFEHQGQVIKVWQAQVVANVTVGAGHCVRPDNQFCAHPKGIDIATKQGILRIIELQLPGAKRQSVKDLLNGHPDLFK